MPELLQQLLVVQVDTVPSTHGVVIGKQERVDVFALAYLQLFAVMLLLNSAVPSFVLQPVLMQEAWTYVEHLYAKKQSQLLGDTSSF